MFSILFIMNVNMPFQKQLHYLHLFLTGFIFIYFFEDMYFLEPESVLDSLPLRND